MALRPPDIAAAVHEETHVEGSAMVLGAAVVFVGSHFLLSHPLRRPLAGSMGEAAFLGVYSLVAALTLVWLVLAYRRAPTTAPLWPVGDGLWLIATLLMLLASVLLIGSFVRNPAFPTGGAAPPAARVARGVFAVTRHPMMWAFATWGVCHVLVYPVTKNIVLAAAIALLALVGAALQDRKKRQLQPTVWPAWEAQTSYWPFAAIAQGRARFGGFGAHALFGGLLLWLLATWAHAPLSGFAAGIWRWINL
jgi:uncharacterized membrane protein